ncbi:hypothetical protein R1sor_001528 [Riccia sorocarpa]|uniref:Uncharacterized protein n=1 Tax=Riccia sorocarpa TaxID=122646 RepID=A0ABD3GY54_9MARC
MPRPPRSKYPIDSKYYHEMRRPGFVHTVRLPEDFLQTYDELKHALRPHTSHADVISHYAPDDLGEVVEDSDPEAVDLTGSSVGNVCPDSQVPEDEDSAMRVYQDATNGFWSKAKRNHGTPDVTGSLYHTSLCSGMGHIGFESMCLELGLHVPRRAHFFDF